jgi:hypothetical protein
MPVTATEVEIKFRPRRMTSSSSATLRGASDGGFGSGRRLRSAGPGVLWLSINRTSTYHVRYRSDR